VLASNLANVVEVTLDYERSSSSIGRMSVLFDDPLAEPIFPPDHITTNTPAEQPVGVAEVIDLRPRLDEVEVEF
ncbi:MAG: hypothetical protein AAGA65_31500, partial [Actinomycetota bacterium]